MANTPTVLITGASSGIGLDLARIFAIRKYRVILVARSTARLEEIARELRGAGAPEVWVEPCDLSDREGLESWVNDLHARMRAKGIELDVLVNSAGFGIEQEFSESEWAADRELLDLNVVALVRLTKRFVPGMRARGRGRVLQVASTAAFQPGPGMALYFASKSFVLSFSQGLAAELRGSGVTVTTVCPGPTHTGFEARLGGESKLFSSGLPVADSREVAEFAYRALMSGKRVAIHGIRNRFLRELVRWVPSSLSLWVMTKMIGKKLPGTKHSEDLPAA